MPDLPLCAYCVVAAHQFNMYAELYAEVGEGSEVLMFPSVRVYRDGSDRTLSLAPGESERVHQLLAGQPLKWEAFLRDLAAYPRHLWRLTVNAHLVGVVGTHLVDGTQVCGMHSYAALERQSKGWFPR